MAMSWAERQAFLFAERTVDEVQRMPEPPTGLYEVRVLVPAGSAEQAVADIEHIVAHAISQGYDIGDTAWHPRVQTDGARRVG